MAYALKVDGNVMPLTGLIDPKVLIEGGRNTIVYEQDEQVRAGRLQAVRDQPLAVVERRQPAATCSAACRAVQVPEELGYENLFRVIIMQFIDALRLRRALGEEDAACTSCTRDGRLIPFDTYNLFYRDDLEQTRLAPLRAQQDAWRDMVGV